jgi:hypothetical protein
LEKLPVRGTNLIIFINRRSDGGGGGGGGDPGGRGRGEEDRSGGGEGWGRARRRLEREIRPWKVAVLAESSIRVMGSSAREHGRKREEDREERARRE